MAWKKLFLFERGGRAVLCFASTRFYALFGLVFGLEIGHPDSRMC